MPKEGDPHPRNPELVCNRLTTSGRLGTDSWTVVAEYGYPGFTSSPSPPPDKTKPYVKWLSGGFAFREIQIPYFRLYTYRAVGANPLVPLLPLVPLSIKTGYEQRDPIRFAVRQAVYKKTVTVTSFTESDAIRIFNEANRIHTIGSRKYLFTGANFSQESVNGYTIHYEWVYEQDTDLTTLLDPLSTPLEFSILAANGNNKRLLPAYHDFVLNQKAIPDIPNATVSIVPGVTTALMYTENPGGGTTLPGDPLST
jgi:hypothetical protein